MNRLRSFTAFCLFVIFPATLVTAATPAKPPPNAVDVTAKQLAVREQMVRLSRQLGVTCSYCHTVADFKDGSMETFKTASAHMQMVDSLNAKGVRGLPHVDCYLCHQGHAKFRHHEPNGEKKSHSQKSQVAEPN